MYANVSKLPIDPGRYFTQLNSFPKTCQLSATVRLLMSLKFHHKVALN